MSGIIMVIERYGENIGLGIEISKLKFWICLFYVMMGKVYSLPSSISSFFIFLLGKEGELDLNF